jgi:hypothetical protein
MIKLHQSLFCALYDQARMLIINNFIDCGEESKNSLLVAVSRSSTTAQAQKQIQSLSAGLLFVQLLTRRKRYKYQCRRKDGQTDRLKDRQTDIQADSE